MSFPDLTQAPEDFLVHVNALGLDSISTAFVHYQKRPIQSAGGWYDEDSAEQWCECMDALLGKATCAMASQLIHNELFSTVKALCTGTITEVEDGLAKQRESDQAAAKRVQEEQKQKAEEVRIAAEHEEKERQEKVAKMEQNRREIEAEERALNAKKQALHDAEKAAGSGSNNSIDDVEDEEDNDEGSDDQQGTSKSMLRRDDQEESCRNLPQTTHANLCELCARTDKTICTGPIGQACNVCWRSKKSCSNGGRRRTREVVVKEEPKSPGNGGSRKRKMYSTTDSTPIGTIDPPDIDFNLTQPDGKRQRVAAKVASRVRFDGVAVPHRPPATTRVTRKSTKATKPNTKELFMRLRQELQNVAKSIEEIAEALD